MNSGTQQPSPSSDRGETAAIASAPPVWPLHIELSELAAFREPLLGAIGFGVPIESSGFPTVEIPMRQIRRPDRVEVWASSLPVTYGSRGRIRYATNDEVLLGTIAFPRERGTIDRMTYRAYAEIFQLLRATEYPYLLRVWNHLGGINEVVAGIERYQAFSVGRYQSFADQGYRMKEDLPAASAVGACNKGLYIYFLASRMAGTQIENPRQVSAYAYPREYGPRSPSFSRATVKRWGSEWQVYLSGTASIVGHETKHRNDVNAQLDETIRNMEMVLARAAESYGGQTNRLRQLSTVKVYLRRPDDLWRIEPGILQVFGEEASILYLEGDICRSDLLLEIEAVARVQ